MKLQPASLVLAVLLAATACGGGASPQPQSGPLSGNWQLALARHAAPVPPLIFTGFLVQSGDSISGSLILGSKCRGVGPITGTVNGQDVSLIINEFGEQISLEGTMPTASTPMGGEFSNLAGGCTAYANTGTWTATQITPIAGSFRGTLTSTIAAPFNNGILNVTGTLNQGPNTGSSNATLSGTITASGAPHFCSYLSTATITGLISGTTVTLGFWGPDGSQIAVIPNPQGSPPTGTVSTDGTSLSGNYDFPAISKSCPGDQGNIQLTFP